LAAALLGYEIEMRTSKLHQLHFPGKEMSAKLNLILYLEPRPNR
jgi:hypothetical protein